MRWCRSGSNLQEPRGVFGKFFLLCLALLLFGSGPAVAEFELVFDGDGAKYGIDPETVTVTKRGVEVVAKVLPKRPEKFGGIHVMNTLMIMSRSRQMKSVYAVGYDRAGTVVSEGNPDGPGWKMIKPGTA